MKVRKNKFGLLSQEVFIFNTDILAFMKPDVIILQCFVMEGPTKVEKPKIQAVSCDH